MVNLLSLKVVLSKLAILGTEILLNNMRFYVQSSLLDTILLVH